MSQRVTEVLCVNGLILGEDLRVHNPKNVTENLQHALGCAHDLRRLPQSWRLQFDTNPPTTDDDDDP